MENSILVTGGSGYIGGALVSHLRAEGHKVEAPTRKELNVRYIDHIQHFLMDRKFSAMILCHGGYGMLGKMKELHMSEWGEALAINLTGTMALIRYAHVDGPIIIFGGGQGGRIPLPERSAFAASKAALNALVLTGAAEGLPIYGVAPGPLPSMMNHELLRSNISESVKDEMRESLRHGVGVENTLDIIDNILAGRLTPGQFYAAREWVQPLLKVSHA